MEPGFTHATETYYATIAQIIPVLLLAVAVELRFVSLVRHSSAFVVAHMASVMGMITALLSCLSVIRSGTDDAWRYGTVTWGFAAGFAIFGVGLILTMFNQAGESAEESKG